MPGQQPWSSRKGVLHAHERPAASLLGALPAASYAPGDAAPKRGGEPFLEQRPTARRQKTMDFSTWENVALTIPGRSAGCRAAGTVLIVADGSYGRPQAIWRGTLKCFTSNKAQCPMSEILLGSPSWPGVNVAGFSDNVQASSDRQIVRFGDGTILLVHQGVRRDAGTRAPCDSAAGTCRGAEYSLHSTDCGQTWRFVSVPDPASDGPAAGPDRYYDRTTQHGHDRPEVYADPFNPGRVYLTALGWLVSASTVSPRATVSACRSPGARAAPGRSSRMSTATTTRGRSGTTRESASSAFSRSGPGSSKTLPARPTRTCSRSCANEATCRRPLESPGPYRNARFLPDVADCGQFSCPPVRASGPCARYVPARRRSQAENT